MNIFKNYKKPFLILAPMVNITDPIYRHMCIKNNADYTYTEMISSNSIIHNNKKIDKLCFSLFKEKQAIQVFGNTFEILSKSISIIEEKYSPNSIDINMGCPSYKIRRIGCGSEMLKMNTNNLYGLIKDIVSITKTPLTIKMRILNNYNKTIDITKKFEDAGIKALVIHGRTSEMKYKGKSSIDIIKLIKKNISIPIIANGDIDNVVTANNILEYTECDGLMIGRAAIGNPSIFNEIKYETYKKNNKQFYINEHKKFNYLKEYCQLVEKYDLYDIVHILNQAQFFFKGTKFAKKIRTKINSSDFINNYKNRCISNKIEYLLNTISIIIES